MLRTVLVIVMLLLCMSNQVRAEDTDTANYVFLGCRDLLLANGNGATAFEQGMCAGKIATLLELQSSLGFRRPTGSNYGQALRIVLKFLDEHPASTHLSFTALSQAALLDAWPCK